ncbi:MAG: CD225/dispanin family protein [Arenimonas sp.]
MVWAILATLLCCIPGGIVAIVYAAQVDGKLAAGDYQGALESSNNAKLWSWISFGTAAALVFLYFLSIIFVVAMGGAH